MATKWDKLSGLLSVDFGGETWEGRGHHTSQQLEVKEQVNRLIEQEIASSLLQKDQASSKFLAVAGFKNEAIEEVSEINESLHRD